MSDSSPETVKPSTSAATRGRLGRPRIALDQQPLDQPSTSASVQRGRGRGGRPPNRGRPTSRGRPSKRRSTSVMADRLESIVIRSSSSSPSPPPLEPKRQRIIEVSSSSQSQQQAQPQPRRQPLTAVERNRRYRANLQVAQIEAIRAANAERMRRNRRMAALDLANQTADM